MASVVMYGNEFQNKLDMGLSPEQFKYRFLAEGDSWMDRSSMFETSLLQKLAPEMQAGGDDVLIINLAMFGDTMRRIGDCVNFDFAQWLRTQFNWRFDGILLSAGGNDFIDAARDPDAGKGILFDLANRASPATGHECLDREAVGKLVTKWLDPSFAALYDLVQSSRHADVPIFLNSYDTPVARNAPAFSGGKSWLLASYQKNSIPKALWPDLTDSIFNDMQMVAKGWAMGRANVVVVPTDGTLVPADADSTGSSGDWLNEIHPNATGWKKLAKVWRQAIKSVI